MTKKIIPEGDEYWWLDDEFDIGAWSWIDELELYGYEKDEKDGDKKND